METVGTAFTDSLGGIKHFQDFKKADYNGIFESAKIVPFRVGADLGKEDKFRNPEKIRSEPIRKIIKKITQRGAKPRDGLGKGVGGFKKTIVIRLFEIMKIVYPPKRAAKADPKGSILTSVLINYRLGNGFGTFKNSIVIRLYEILKMFYPPKGSATDPMGSI